MRWNELKDMNLAQKIVLTRVDINVPFEDNQIMDWTRIDRIRPTIDQIIAQGGKPVLLAHFGRPKGQIVPEMSLETIAFLINDRWDLNVRFASDCIGAPAISAIHSLNEGDVLLLENTRFHAGEEKNDPAFAKTLAENGDIFCNDAFSAAHRAHASTEGIAHFLPSCAGLLMAEELSALSSALATPKPPVTAIVGGAKISTKLDLLANLINKVDHLVIGGGMANTFLAAQGADVGRSLCETDLLPTAREILSKSQSQNCEIILPMDVVTAKEFAANTAHEVHPADACPTDQMILDAGPKSIEKINSIIASSQSLLWNGPLGAFEIPPFDQATNSVAQFAAKQTEKGKLLSVAGGGDTVAALNGSDSAKNFSYVSTAGGAFLEWIEGKELPGVLALENSINQ